MVPWVAKFDPRDSAGSAAATPSAASLRTPAERGFEQEAL